MTDPTPDSPESSSSRRLAPWVLAGLVVAALGVGLAVALMDSDHHDAARFDATHHGANMPMGSPSSMPHQGSTMPHNGGTSSMPMGGGTSTMPMNGAASDTSGLTASSAGFSMRLVHATGKVGANRLALRIERDGRTMTRGYEVQHTKRLHVVVARRDMSVYAHLHPTMGADGTWTDTVTLDEPGPYRVFADFQVAGVKRVLGADLTVPGDYQPVKLPHASTSATVDGYRVTVNRDAGSGDVRFQVWRAGKPVADLAQVLGARGHLVALRASDLAYLHTHPDESVTGNRIDFDSEFPSGGAYRLFLQFSAGGAVRTARFTVNAS